jgi:hypothetical protein
MMKFFLNISISINQSAANEALSTCRKMLSNVNSIRIVLSSYSSTPEAWLIYLCLLNEAVQMRSKDFVQELLWDIG